MQEINHILKDLYNGKLVKKNGTPYSQVSIDHYYTTLKRIEFDFEGTDKKSLNKWCADLRGKLKERGISKNSENQYISAVVWLFGKLDEIYGIHMDTRSPIWSRQQTVDPYIPEPDRILDFIKNFKPRTQGQEKAFEYIKAAYFTSARFSDMARWNRGNVVGNNLVYIQGKRGKRVSIPLNGSFRVPLPKLSKTTVWAYIKECFREYGFTNNISRNVDGILVTKEEWELISIHRLRAASITGMLTSGMNQLEVKAFSGHSRNSTSFERYVGFSQKHLDEKISKFIRL